MLICHNCNPFGHKTLADECCADGGGKDRTLKPAAARAAPTVTAVSILVTILHAVLWIIGAVVFATIAVAARVGGLTFTALVFIVNLVISECVKCFKSRKRNGHKARKATRTRVCVLCYDKFNTAYLGPNHSVKCKKCFRT